MGRSAVGRVTSIVVLGVSLTGSWAVAQTRAGLGKYLPGYEVARYLPESGRLVLEHQGKFIVLRRGDEVPGLPGVRLASADRRGALLVESADGETAAAGDGVDLAPKRWLRLVPDKSGGVQVIAILAQPEEGLALPEADPGLSVLHTAPEPSGDPASGGPAVPAEDSDGAEQ